MIDLQDVTADQLFTALLAARENLRSVGNDRRFSIRITETQADELRHGEVAARDQAQHDALDADRVWYHERFGRID